jgi:hypothetical protein
VILIENWLPARGKLLRTIETFIANQRITGTAAANPSD